MPFVFASAAFEEGAGGAFGLVELSIADESGNAAQSGT